MAFAGSEQFAQRVLFAGDGAVAVDGPVRLAGAGRRLLERRLEPPAAGRAPARPPRRIQSREKIGKSSLRKLATTHHFEKKDIKRSKSSSVSPYSIYRNTESGFLVEIRNQSVTVLRRNFIKLNTNITFSKETRPFGNFARFTNDFHSATPNRIV